MSRQQTLEDLFYKLKESGSESDFPLLLADSMHKILLPTYTAFASTWRLWCKIMPNIMDFKDNKRIKLTEVDDLEEVTNTIPPKETSFDESQASYAIKIFERVFGIPWTWVINNDIGAIQQIPQALGRASASTVAKFFVNLLKGITASQTVTSALSETSLAAALLEMKTRADANSGNPITVIPKYLIVPPALEVTAKRVLNSQQLIAIALSAQTPTVQGSYNAVNAGETNLITCVEPLLTDADDWYLAADPNVTPGIEAGFFRNQTEPRIYVESSGIQGNENPFESGNFWNRKINYKASMIFGGTVIDTNALLKVAVSG